MDPTIMFKICKFDIRKLEEEKYFSLFKYLQEDEIKKAKRFHFIIDGKRSVAGHILVKTKLALLHNKKIDEIIFTKTKENKPIWEEYNEKKYPNLNFNISHSGDWVLFGFSSPSILGLDVQEIKIPGKDSTLAKFLRIMKSSFTFKEYCCIALQVMDNYTSYNSIDYFLDHEATEEQTEKMKDRLFCYWVLKEAFIKSIGAGLGYDLKKVEFIFEGVEDEQPLFGKIPKIFIDGDETKDVFAKVFQVDKTHAGAFCFVPSDYHLIKETFSDSFKGISNKDMKEKFIELSKNINNIKIENVEIKTFD